MKTAWLVALACAACAACGRDIRLGSEAPAPDAMPDASGNPFTAGAYAASFLDPVMITCSGSLAGHESDFSGITRAQVHFVDGTVQLAPGATQLVVTGAPITTAFGVASVTLVFDPGSTPPTLWDISLGGSFGSGPDATTAMGLAFALDSATARAPSGIEGAIAVEYVTASNDGACTASFGALLVSS